MVQPSVRPGQAKQGPTAKPLALGLPLHPRPVWFAGPAGEPQAHTSAAERTRPESAGLAARARKLGLNPGTSANKSVSTPAQRRNDLWTFDSVADQDMCGSSLKWLTPADLCGAVFADRKVQRRADRKVQRSWPPNR